MKKLYYSIGEVSEITSVEPHILRYWESIFDDLDPSKNSSGKRTYTDRHIKLILQLKELIQVKKYSTKGAKKVLENQGNTTNDTRRDTIQLQKDLNEIKVFLERLKNQL